MNIVEGEDDDDAEDTSIEPNSRGLDDKRVRKYFTYKLEDLLEGGWTAEASQKCFEKKEVSKHKLIAKDAKKESAIYKQKIEMLETKNRELEDQINKMQENTE